MALAASAVVPAQCSVGSNPTCVKTTATYSTASGAGLTYLWSIISSTAADASIVGSNTGSSVSVYSGSSTGTIDLQVTVSNGIDFATCDNTIIVQAANANAGDDKIISCLPN